MDGIVCGHIHKADLVERNGLTYCNDGDWVESCTALVEHAGGESRADRVAAEHRGCASGASAARRCVTCRWRRSVVMRECGSRPASVATTAWLRRPRRDAMPRSRSSSVATGLTTSGSRVPPTPAGCRSSSWCERMPITRATAARRASYRPPGRRRESRPRPRRSGSGAPRSRVTTRSAVRAPRADSSTRGSNSTP